MGDVDTQLTVLVGDWLKTLRRDFYLNGDVIVYDHVTHKAFMKSTTTYPCRTSYKMATITDNTVRFDDLELNAAHPHFFRQLRSKFYAEIEKINYQTSTLRIIGTSWLSFVDLGGHSSDATTT